MKGNGSLENFTIRYDDGDINIVLEIGSLSWKEEYSQPEIEKMFETSSKFGSMLAKTLVNCFTKEFDESESELNLITVESDKD